MGGDATIKYVKVVILGTNSTQFMTQLRQCLTAQPLWTFAVDFYARSGVEQACLSLQDNHGWDVCELLWRCWLFQHGAQAGELAPEIRRWQAGVTQPLRRLRRELKPESCHSTAVFNLREQIKKSELAAERETMNRLMKISLKDSTLTPLPVPHPGLEKVLLSDHELKKKSQVRLIATLETQLDPPCHPR